MSAAPKRFQSNVPLFIFLQLCVWATRCSTLCSYAFYELSVCLCTFVFRSVCLMARLSHVLFWPVLFSCTFVQSAPACSTSLPFAEIRSRFGQTTPSPSREVRARIAAMQNMHMGLVWSDGLLLALAHFFRPVCAGRPIVCESEQRCPPPAPAPPLDRDSEAYRPVLASSLGVAGRPSKG